MFIRVDFPDPDGPMIATNSPLWIVREMPLSTWSSCDPRRYVFVMAWRVIMREAFYRLRPPPPVRKPPAPPNGERPPRAPFCPSVGFCVVRETSIDWMRSLDCKPERTSVYVPSVSPVSIGTREPSSRVTNVLFPC